MRKNKSKFSAKKRVACARDVFDCAFGASETFRVDNIGADLAYLMGAILDDDKESFVDWTRDAHGDMPPPLLAILEKGLPRHPAWRFIVKPGAHGKRIN